MILPEINTVCAYQFTTDFVSLNGIYTLVDLTSFNEAIAEGVDFVADLYTPAGVESSQYATDAPTYKNDAVLHLTPVNPGGVALYVPQTVLAVMADPMVGCYNALALGISLGVFDDATTLNWIVSELNAIISATIGVSNPVKVYSLGTQYMRIADYAALVATRQAAQSSYATLYEQLQAQIALTQKAQTLNQYYQNTLIALGNPP